ncbi:hypothetical protein IE53DRAFT_384834 [Violaceomyces palustris]|uniref:Uncharacterized protein n=1 Tax=Violaceomyces palustris TaxID=1673888 RepID=A0ACD0P3J6_9BASI|nr:hypothetical protein IE53DRAFT_384834 [Violaceomyces palustris]
MAQELADPTSEPAQANAPSPGSESQEDDNDFVPPSLNQISTHGERPPADDDSDEEDSSGSDSEGGRGRERSYAGKKRKGNRDDEHDDDDEDGIDPEEVEAARKEREEMIKLAGGEHMLGKRRRREADGSRGREDGATSEQRAAAQSEADRVWAEMKGTSSSTSDQSKQPPETEKGKLEGEEMVRVVQTFKFAGDITTTEKLLPASHPEAIAFLKGQAKGVAETSRVAEESQRPSLATTESTSGSAPSPRPTKGLTPPSPSTTTAPKPGPRRKKGSSLAAMSAAATSKPIKLNTLEKSKMDWEDKGKKVMTQAERDEMEAQTKGGGSGLGSMKGYLERRDFLDRVERRLEEK